MDLLVGETLVRKLVTSVTLTLVSTSLGDLEVEVAVTGLESHDVYLRPIDKESFTRRKHVIGRVPLR